MPNYLNGGTGSNTYQYNLGGGDAIITDTGSANDVDTLVLSGAGLTAANIIVKRNGTSNQLKIIFKNIAGSILLQDQLYGNYGVEKLIFSDGTVWNEEQLWDSYLKLAADTDDRLDGTISNNTLIGGKGDDILDGGSGSDTYTYRLGDGNDTLMDTGSSNDIDHLAFSGTGLTAANAVVTRVGTTNNLKIAFKNNIAGSIVLKDQLYGNYGVEKITFSDGSIWNEAQLQSAYLGTPPVTTTISGNSFDNTLVGTSGNNILIGGKGNDYLQGEGGSDTYRYNLGDGNDTLGTSN